LAKHNIYNLLRVSNYDERRFFIIFLTVIVTLVVDVSISEVSDVFSRQLASNLGIVLFIIISGIYGVGQFLILNMIKAKNKESELGSVYTNRLEKMVTVVQYVLTAITVAIILEIVLLNQYYTNLLTAAVAISYGLAAVMMSILAYRLFSWFTLNKSLLIIIYGLAAAMIAVNAVDSILYFDGVLVGKTATVYPQSEVIFQTGFVPGTPLSLISLVQTYSLIAYFLLTWAGTILLLRHNIQRIGKIKFGILVTSPLIFFMSYYIPYYQALNPTSPVTTVTSSNLLIPVFMITYSITLCGILFGMGFRSIARAVGKRINVRDYMIITAYGFVLYFNTAQATVLQAGYPPFGLANVSFVGLSSFLVLIGLYQSAISVGKDINLRKLIRKSALRESELLDNIGTAELEKGIREKVMELAETKTEGFADIAEPSMSENEIRVYLDQVIDEVKRKRGQ
jgi:hypothetical protein